MLGSLKIQFLGKPWSLDQDPQICQTQDPDSKPQIFENLDPHQDPHEMDADLKPWQI